MVTPLKKVLTDLQERTVQVAFYRVHVAYVSKGQQAGGSVGFHRYLRREGLGEGQQYHRYVVRDHGRHQGVDDVIETGQGGLPAWSGGNPDQFWAAADRYERVKGPVFFHLTVALPRQVSPAGRSELAADIREVLVGRFPHSYAIHEPVTNTGEIQPHMHLQFSSRREEVERGLSAEQWFRQPNHGGTPKDASWFTKGRLHDVREAVALLTNGALQREGVGEAVDHRSLEAQGFSRDPARYGERQHAGAGQRLSSQVRQQRWKADQERTLQYRRELRANDTLEYESRATYAHWQDQSVTLLSMDRTYVRDLCRDHLWRYDRSPARQLEREQGMVRSLDLAMDLGVHTRTPAPQRTMGRGSTSQGTSLLSELREMAQQSIQEGGPQGRALPVKLHERDDEKRERGMGW